MPAPAPGREVRVNAYGVEVVATVTEAQIPERVRQAGRTVPVRMPDGRTRFYAPEDVAAVASVTGMSDTYHRDA